MISFDELIGRKSLHSDIGIDDISESELPVDAEKYHNLECEKSYHEHNQSNNGQNANKGSNKVKRFDIIDIIKGMIIEMFVDQIGEAYAAVRINDHIEAIPISSTRFKEWIIKTHYDYEKAFANGGFKN